MSLTANQDVMCYRDHIYIIHLLLSGLMFLEISSMGSRPPSEGSNPSLGPRQFLSKFKTIECKSREERCRDPYQCEFYHDSGDLRRNPYYKNCIQYAPEICSETFCQQYPVPNQLTQNCAKSHSLFELEFHPLNYLTSKCTKYYNCERNYCPYYHDKQLERLGSTGCFFRFDLITFKTKSCIYQYPHDLKICLFHHNLKDRRRPRINYEHVLCDNYQTCQLGDNCLYAHNKIQQLYHPSRYKSKFCEKYPYNLAECEYKEFCSFAHYKSEIAIDLIDDKQITNEFMINEYKTVWCPYTNHHDRKKCVYAHNVQDFRRAPNQYNYEPEQCLNWNKTKNLKSLQMGGCSKGMLCNKCHGWKELQYHPMIFGKRGGNRRYNNRNVMYDTPNCVKQDIIKKLNEKGPKNYVAQQKIEPVMVNQQITAMVGAPFFKSDHERDLSVTDKVAKPVFRGSASDVASNSKSKPSKRRESLDSFESKHQQKEYKTFDQLFSWNIHHYPNEYEDSEEKYYDYFRKNEVEEPLCKSFKERTRSCDKDHQKNFEIMYSRSLQQLFQGSLILDKLKNHRISQIKLINLPSDNFDHLAFLHPQEKHLLQQKIHEYNAKCQDLFISYSTELTEFFKKHNRQDLLDKIRRKKVKQHKLLGLLDNQIQSFSFIEEEDKKILPKLIRNFNDNKEFSDLNSMISLQTKISNSTNELDELLPTKQQT